uniref:Uncharacterized protein n=1 Tax=Anguilla anguilla TaxID=7936 RepID=A0A0E9VV57_ANGAN
MSFQLPAKYQVHISSFGEFCL